MKNRNSPPVFEGTICVNWTAVTSPGVVVNRKSQVQNMDYKGRQYTLFKEKSINKY